MNKIKNRNSLVKPVVGFNGIELVPNVLRGGMAINNGDGTFTFRGRTHKTGGIDVGNIEVEDKEIGKSLSDGGMAILSAHRRFPSLRGVSPAEYYQITGDFDTPFILQETDKQMGRVNNNKRKAAKGALFAPALSVPAFTPIAPIISTETDKAVVTPAATENVPTAAATTTPTKRSSSRLNPMPIINVFDVIRGIRNSFSAPKNNVEEITEEVPYYPSENIVRYLKETEAFRPNVYLDGNGVETIGYGTTAATKAGKKAFAKYRKTGMTEAQASDVMNEVIREMLPSFISSTPNFNKLNNNERDALFSYFYNVGIGNYTTKSPGMQRALKDLNREQIMAQMDIGYNDSKNPGLRKRRDKERAIFATPVGTTYENGGIHIDKNKRGTFKAAATKHGMGVQQFASKVLANKEDYSPAMVKKANFARNATKWKMGGVISINGNVKNGLIYANGGRAKAKDGIVVGGTYGGGTGGGGGAGSRFSNSNYVAVEVNGQTMLIPISVALGNNNLNGQPIRYIRPNVNTRRIANTSTPIEGTTPIPIRIESEPTETNVVRDSDNGIINGGQLNDLIVTPQTNGLDYSDPDYGKVKLVNNNGVYSYVPIKKENSFDATTPKFLTRPYVSGYRDLRGLDYPAQFIPGNTNPATEEVIVEPSINTEETPVIETTKTTPNNVGSVTTPSRRVSSVAPQASNPAAPANNPVLDAARAVRPTMSELPVGSGYYVPYSVRRTLENAMVGDIPSLATAPIVPTGNIDLAAISERRAANDTSRLVPQMSGGNKLDYITAGANALGTILGSIGTNMLLNRTPKVSIPVSVSGPKLKTTYNINPQLDEIERQQYRSFRDADNNTASSSVALARKRGISANALAARNNLYGTKENYETQLINQDRIYDYQARRANANVYNNYLTQRFNRDSNLLNARISNFNNALSNLSSIGMNLADRIENRRAFNRNLMAIAMSNPNVDARNIFGPDSAFARALGITYVPV